MHLIISNSCLLLVLPLLFLLSCKERSTKVETPWGTTIETEGENIGADSVQSDVEDKAARYTLKDIQQGGEMIMLTLSGPDTYYDYHGKGMGVHYLLCEKLAEHIGVTLRVDVCRDTLEMLQRLRNGEGDIIAYPLDKKSQEGFVSCAANWMVRKNSEELANVVNAWYKPSLMADTKKQEQQFLAVGNVTRRVYPVMLSASKGQISNYDVLFRKYASTAGVDWVMMAAQCYQESCFDPRAHSWAGACGLMQIMPSTADHLSLPRDKMYEPEPNVAAAARLLRELQGQFKDIGSPAERIKFALAAYNAGYYHIRDAMALTKKYGGIPQRWSDVKKYVLLLQNAQYYRDPVVRYGYMRGSETANYVDMITERHAQYREALRTGGRVVSTVKAKKYKEEDVSFMPVSGSAAAHRATKKNKWRKD